MLSSTQAGLLLLHLNLGWGKTLTSRVQLEAQCMVRVRCKRSSLEWAGREAQAAFGGWMLSGRYPFAGE